MTFLPSAVNETKPERSSQRTGLYTMNDTSTSIASRILAAHTIPVKKPRSFRRNGGLTKEELIQKFLWSVNFKENGCWEIAGANTRPFYGRINVGKKSVLAHRFSYETFVGPIPDDLWVLHHCDNRPCANPDHLFLGTPLDNLVDMTTKGRRVSCPGIRNGQNKLTEEQVLEIRRLFDSKELNQRRIAEMFGVHFVTVHCIVMRKQWKHLP